VGQRQRPDLFLVKELEVINQILLQTHKLWGLVTDCEHGYRAAAVVGTVPLQVWAVRHPMVLRAEISVPKTAVDPHSPIFQPHSLGRRVEMGMVTMQAIPVLVFLRHPTAIKTSDGGLEGRDENLQQLAILGSRIRRDHQLTVLDRNVLKS